MTLDFILVIVYGFMLIANLIILGLSLKLYTELMKDQNMNKRFNKNP